MLYYILPVEHNYARITKKINIYIHVYIYFGIHCLCSLQYTMMKFHYRFGSELPLKTSSKVITPQQGGGIKENRKDKWRKEEHIERPNKQTQLIFLIYLVHSLFDLGRHTMNFNW